MLCHILFHILSHIVLICYHILLTYCTYVPCILPHILPCMLHHILLIYSPYIIHILIVYLYFYTNEYETYNVHNHICTYIEGPSFVCSPFKKTHQSKIVNTKCIQWFTKICSVKVVKLYKLNIVFAP